MDPKRASVKNIDRNISGRTSIHLKPLKIEARSIFSDGEDDDEEEKENKDWEASNSNSNSNNDLKTPDKEPEIEITLVKVEENDEDEKEIKNSEKEAERLKTKLEFMDVVSSPRKKNRNYSIINEKKVFKKPTFLSVDRDYSSLYVASPPSPIVEMQKSKSQRNNFEKISDLSQSKNIKNFMKKSSIGQIIKKMSKSEEKLKQKKESFKYSNVFGQPYFQYFKMFLISEYSIENALFIESVEKYKNLTGLHEREREAKLIYKEYFEDNSLKELNVCESSKVQISLNIKIQKITPLLFDEVVKELKSGILQDSYWRFVKTNYFNEMFNE